MVRIKDPSERRLESLVPIDLNLEIVWGLKIVDDLPEYASSLAILLDEYESKCCSDLSTLLKSDSERDSRRAVLTF